MCLAILYSKWVIVVVCVTICTITAISIQRPVCVMNNENQLTSKVWIMAATYQIFISEVVINVNILKLDMLPGQSCVRQDSLTVLSPSQMPPCISSTFFVLLFDLVPPPHVLEHSPICHSFHSQSIGAPTFSIIEVTYKRLVWKYRQCRSKI